MRTSARLPKHQQVREILRRQILDGTYPPGSALPPETVLPRRMRVSKITVVRALGDLVREGLIVRRRGSGSFVADPEHRPLIPGRFLRLGLLLPHSAYADFRYGPLQTAMIRGALETWGLARVRPVFPRVREEEATRGSWTSESKGASVELLGEEPATRLRHPPLEAVREGRFDGLLSLSVTEAAWVEALLDLNVPAVLVDYPNERFTLRADQVFFDPLPGYRAAVRRLAEQGCRRIHFLGCWQALPYARVEEMHHNPAYFAPENARPDPDSFLRLSAWRQAMAECGLPAPEEWVHWSWSGGEPLRELAATLAELPESERPQAVVCHGAGQGQELIEHFAARGLTLAAAGADTAPAGGEALTICSDPQALGKTAASLLLWKLQQPDRPFLRVGVPMVFETVGEQIPGGTR